MSEDDLARTYRGFADRLRALGDPGTARLLEQASERLSDMSGNPNLELIQRQLNRVLNEVGDFRDQMTVLTAITMRIESAVTALTIEVRAMHSRYSRLDRRVGELETAREEK